MPRLFIILLVVRKIPESLNTKKIYRPNPDGVAFCNSELSQKAFVADFTCMFTYLFQNCLSSEFIFSCLSVILIPASWKTFSGSLFSEAKLP